MKNNIQQRVSLLIFCLLSLTIIFNRLLLPRFNTHDVLSIISWDVFGYYLYLPAALIHHDLGISNFAWVQEILNTYHPTIGFYQAYPGPTGEYIMKYPVGMAIMYSPFYLTGQVFAHLTGFSPDGFTLPYQVSIAIGGLVYTVIGLWFLRKILLNYFTDGVAACTMIVIVLGTNYFQLTAFDGAMPHNYLFTLFALIIWLTIRWNNNFKWKYPVLLGLLCGLATLVRPTSIIILLIPLLTSAIIRLKQQDKLAMNGRYLSQVLVLMAVMLLVVGIQMVYWKLYSGSWLYYSYEKGEKLEWIAPYLKKVLFSYKKGWLVYTPIMIFAIIGFLPLAKKNRSISLVVGVFFIIHLLIISSWPTWWYGGSLGQRTMMESYVLLALPLGAFIQWFSKQHRIVKWPIWTGLFFLMCLNLFQTWQYMHFILDPSRMTKGYYWMVFGKTRVTDIDRIALEPTTDIYEKEFIPNPESYHSKLIASYNFETTDQSSPENLCRDTAKTGNYSLRMSKKMEFSPGIKVPYKDLAKIDYAWIRATAWVYFNCKPEDVASGLVITSYKDNDAYKYRILELGKQNLTAGVWNKVTMDYFTPLFDDKSDPVQSYFWYREDKEFLVDDFEIWVFELKE